FFNGGLLFSLTTLVIIAAISVYVFHLLLETKFVVSGSFEDIGGTLYGPRMRYIILGSIFISQICISSAYTIFVAENIQASVLTLVLITIHAFSSLQPGICIGHNSLRQVHFNKSSHSSSAPRLRSIFSCTRYGEIELYGSVSECIHLVRALVRLKTAVFTFQAIGILIPITDSLREPRKFSPVVKAVMAAVTVSFGAAGSLGYLAFGSKVETTILINLDSSRLSVQIVQLFYALAILLSIPLQFLPAVDILKNWIFNSLGEKRKERTNWQENLMLEPAGAPPKLGDCPVPPRT
ncbi:hypothetical protein C0993_002367, partial [Termitomyces sp. T159_Od127]